MRRFLVLALLLVLGVGVAVYVFLLSPDRILRTAQWAVATFSDYRLQFTDAQLDITNGRFRAAEIHLYPDDPGEAALVSVMGFRGQVGLRDLLRQRLRSTLLQADNVIVYERGEDNSTSPAPAEWLRYLRWLPKQLSLDTLYVVTASDVVRIFVLNDVTGSLLDADTYHLQTGSEVEGERLDADIYLYAMRSARGFRGVQLRGEFYGTRSYRLAIIEGEVRGDTEQFGYDLFLHAAVPDSSKFLAHFPRAPQLPGKLQVRGRMHGDEHGFELENAEFHIYNLPDYEFAAHGDFSYHGDNDIRLKLDADGQMAGLEYLIDWIDLDLTSLGAARAHLAIEGPLDHIRVNAFELNTRHADGLELEVRGSLPPGGVRKSTDAEEQHLSVTLRGPRLDVLQQWLGEVPFDPGPWEVRAVLGGGEDVLHVDELEASLGDPAAPMFTASGAIGRIDLHEPVTAGSVKGIHLAVTAAADSLKPFESWLGHSLPGGHRLQAQSEVTGDGDRLILSAGSAQLESPGLTLTLANAQGLILPTQAWQYRDLRGNLSLALTDTGVLSQYVDATVPALGGLRASAILEQSDERFALREIRANVDSDALTLAARGEVRDLAAMQGLMLKVGFSHLDTRRLLADVKEGFAYDGEPGNLAGAVWLEKNAAQWDLTKINVSGHRSDAFSLRANGTLKDLAGRPRGELALALASHDPDLLRALTGLPLPVLRGDVKVRSRGGLMQLTGNGALRETRWRLDGNLRYARGELRGLQLALASPHLHLQDLGLNTADDSATPGNRPPRPNREAPRDHPLEKLVASLPTFPVDLRLNLDGVSGENTRFRHFDLHLTGEDQQYLVRTLNIAFQNGEAAFRGLIDLKSQPPGLSVAAQALRLDMTNTLRDLGIDSNIRGILNLRGGLSARGGNLEAWVRSLDGSLAFALEDAVIDGAAYDVLATDFLAWIYSGAALQDSTRLQCAMARFDLHSGTASSDSLYVESPRMIATGKGRLNLVERTLDIRLTPRSKERLIQIPSEISITGKMANPKTWVSPITVAADTYAEALMLVPTLTMKLFGLKAGRAAARPCQATLSD